MKNATSTLSTSTNRSLGWEFANAHGLVVGAWSEFGSLDKQVVCFHFGQRQADGSVIWFEPVRSDDTMAFARFPRIILRADGTVFKNLLFNPFA
jgi:hypothetical protein